MTQSTVNVSRIRIPPDVLARLNQGSPHMQLARIALKRGDRPVRLDVSDLPTDNIRVEPAVMKRLSAVAKDEGLDLKSTVAGLAKAGLIAFESDLARARQSAVSENPPPFRGVRDAQETYYRNVASSLRAGRICLAEGSTGLGKSRALIAAAIVRAQDGDNPVVIAAPTLKVLGQLWRELETLREEGVGADVSAGFFPGRTEFVDVEDLRSYFSSEHPERAQRDPDVADWVARGGPVLTAEISPLTRALGQSGAELSFLMADLRRLARNLPVAEFAAQSDEHHPAIDAARDYAASCRIIFCTHAMLARDFQCAWAIFPAPGALIIDEAHEFERNFASVFATSLSLHSLRRRLTKVAGGKEKREGTVAAKTLRAIWMLITALRNIGTDQDQVSDSIDLSPQFAEDNPEIPALMRDLRDLLGSRTWKDVPRIDRDRDALADALGLLRTRIDARPHARSIGWIEFSPDRRFPSIVAGRVDVSSILGGFWKSLGDAGVVLASATLYIPNGRDGHDCDYAVSTLALPRSRLDMPDPVVAPWVTSIPHVRIPSPALAATLSRPQSKARRADTDAESGWLDALAHRIGDITDSALGGTVVLLSSFAQVEAIGSRLTTTRPDDGGRIVRQSPTQKLEVAQNQYQDLHSAGIRPILLATGGAWTGMDIHGVDDTLLTDLVVGCLPVGLNRSTTMKGRIERQGMRPVAFEALTLFKQGIGRLVRSSESRHKNLWVLDGRIWSEWPAMRRLTLGVRQILRAYSRITTI